MRPGGGKAKGGAWEREVCKQLSFWVSKGKSEDLFWRSAMSGGRSTVAHAKGKLVRAAGDICSVAPEGHILTDLWVIECKHVKRLYLDQFLIQETGWLKKVWDKLRAEANRHNKWPLLIAKQNGWPALAITLDADPHTIDWPESILTHSVVNVYDFGEVLDMSDPPEAPLNP
jgi:hypothetical protein